MNRRTFNIGPSVTQPQASRAGSAFLLPILVLAAVAGAPVMHGCDPSAREGTHDLTVFENRTSRSGRKIELNVAVYATDAVPPREPVFVLAGGPGQAATALARFVLSGPVGAARETRDIVFVDQRGTGDSNPLPCPTPATAQGYFGHLFEPEWVSACRAELEKRADLTQYATSIAADDLDDVRSSLGYEKIVVWGGSYGTRMALETMRRHGEHVAAAVLDGVVTFEANTTLRYAYYSQQAMNRVLADCAVDAACHAAYPQLPKTFETLLTRLRSGAKQAQIRASGASVAVSYSLGDFGYTIRGMLYDVDQTARLPKLLTAAERTGNLDAFAQAYYDRAAELDQSLAHGMYLSVMCSEDVLPVGNDERARWTSGTFLGEYLAREYSDACSRWPHGTVPASFHEPLRSSIPTLLLSGGRDPSTPPSDGASVASGLTNSLHVVIPQGGHGVNATPCARGIVSAFLQSYSVHGIDTSCVSAPGNGVPFELP